MEILLYSLSLKGVLVVQGKDRFSFLQGLITQDLSLLEESQGKERKALYSFLLSPQGKYLHDFFIISENEKLLLVTTRVEELRTRLTRYKLRSDVMLECADIYVYASKTHFSEFDLKSDTLIFQDPRKENTFTWILSKEPLQSTQSEEAYHFERIRYGFPESDTDLIPEKTFPLEARLDELNGISFKKGCYVGQEPVARAHYQGVIRKKLLSLQGQGILSNDRKIMSHKEESVGTITSVACRDNLTLAMALLRLEALENSSLSCGGIFFKPINPQSSN